jgi:hypothetical protein
MTSPGASGSPQTDGVFRIEITIQPGSTPEFRAKLRRIACEIQDQFGDAVDVVWRFEATR